LAFVDRLNTAAGVLRALTWSVLSHRHDPEGVPVLFYAFAIAEPRRAGVPASRARFVSAGRFARISNDGPMRYSPGQLGPPSCTSPASKDGTGIACEQTGRAQAPLSARLRQQLTPTRPLSLPTSSRREYGVRFTGLVAPQTTISTFPPCQGAVPLSDGCRSWIGGATRQAHVAHRLLTECRECDTVDFVSKWRA
jgi:hypothetical protein